MPVPPGYAILEELGRGGMGVVYKARQEGLNRLVALKMIRDQANAQPDQLERFRIEAEAVARLRHPNIIQIYDVGLAGGIPYFSLELLEGGSLADRIAGTPQSARPSGELLATLARAMQAAHDSGIVHRDLKPQNVLFDRDGTPKVTDFGLAKRLEVEAGPTLTEDVMGTPAYMAPEQALGKNREVGPLADVYALGAILYAMLTGRPPIQGTTWRETLLMVVDQEPVAPSKLQPKIPRDLETIALKCLAKEPRKRYASALALAEDLERFLDGRPILARRTPAWERGWKWSRRHPVAATLAALALVASIGIVWAVEHRNEDLRQQASQEDRPRRRASAARPSPASWRGGSRSLAASWRRRGWAWRGWRPGSRPSLGWRTSAMASRPPSTRPAAASTTGRPATPTGVAWPASSGSATRRSSSTPARPASIPPADRTRPAPRPGPPCPCSGPSSRAAPGRWARSPPRSTRKRERKSPRAAT